MASASRRGATGKRRGKRAQSSGAGILWLFFAVAVPASVVALPTVLVLSAGMVPSMVALVVDRDPNRTAGITVGSLNLCGVMPFLLELWSQPHHKLPQALQLLSDPLTWMVMFGAAAFGWGVYSVVPLWAAQLEIARAEHRIASLRERQKALVKDWGSDVAALDENGAPAKPLPPE